MINYTRQEPDSCVPMETVDYCFCRDLFIDVGRKMLSLIDASIPNKDQNKALKHLIRLEFDDAYFNLCDRAFPGVQSATPPEGSYALALL